MAEKKLKAFGMISGVGSMLIGAKRQGYEIIGNCEWRPYYHTGTFQHNFPESFMIKTLKDLTPELREKCEDLDLIIGHTECGNFSNLRSVKSNMIDLGDKGDIPEFVEAVQLLKPKFFVMDNLPKSLLVADWSYYMENLPEYEIHFEWISNYGYGNIQKFRKRLFVIGAKRELGFYFVPSEKENPFTIMDRINAIDPMAENNDLLELDAIYAGLAKYQFELEYSTKSVDENRITLRQFQDYIRDYPCGINFPYFNKKTGEKKFKIGFSKIDVTHPANVLSGGGSRYDNHFRSDTLFPFTIRERAKIQGCPDDFVFLPTGVTRTTKEYSHLIKQTGKFMPVEFCTFITGQIKDFLEGNRDESTYSQQRTLNPHAIIDENKWEYCMMNGYSDQDNVCKFCGSKGFCQKKAQHGLKLVEPSEVTDLEPKKTRSLSSGL